MSARTMPSKHFHTAKRAFRFHNILIDANFYLFSFPVIYACLFQQFASRPPFKLLKLNSIIAKENSPATFDKNIEFIQIDRLLN